MSLNRFRMYEKELSQIRADGGLQYYEGLMAPLNNLFKPHLKENERIIESGESGIIKVHFPFSDSKNHIYLVNTLDLANSRKNECKMETNVAYHNRLSYQCPDVIDRLKVGLIGIYGRAHIQKFEFTLEEIANGKHDALVNHFGKFENLRDYIH